MVTMWNLSGDLLEFTAFVAAVLGAVFSGWALRRSTKVWRDASVANPAVRMIALRRVRQQAFHLLVQAIIVISAGVALFLQYGELQASVRSFAITTISLLLLYRAFIEYWEQRTIDVSPEERRWTNRTGPDRRVS